MALFRYAAAQARRVAAYVTVERYLTAAIDLLGRVKTVADEPLLAALQIERHAALYSLGRLDEADEVYRAIEAHGCDALVLVEAACVQVSSLSNRGRPREAVVLGLSLLQQLGLEGGGAVAADEIERKMDTLCRWVQDYKPVDDQARPDAQDPQVVAAARLINRLQTPAFFCDLMIVAWLVLESQRLWVKHGPCAALVANLSRVTLVSIALRQDYRTGYDAVRHVLDMSEARGYEPETSQARHVFAISTCHWFEPVEHCIQQAQRAREGLLHSGELQSACFTYRTSIPALLDCAPTLESYAVEIETGLAFAARTGNEHATAVNLADRQLLRTLRGETQEPGSFTDGDFNEARHLASLVNNPMAVVTFHIRRALAAALFVDPPGLALHAAAAMPLLSFIQGFYPTALAYLLQALALAEQVKAAAPEQRVERLAELDVCRDWLARRAADCPGNYLHLLKLVEAERAWAIDDFKQASHAFDTAIGEVHGRQRAWHKALITERAALFYLAHDMANLGQTLLTQAWHLYAAWGASAKVREMKRCHPFLHGAHGIRHERDQRSTGHDSGRLQGDSLSVSVDTVDMLAILRTSQALSSETSLERLRARVVELLGEITGATQVLLVLWRGDPPGWYLSATDEEGAVPLSVTDLGARQRLPLSAFHYAERTRQPLLVEDATRDDRFASDPYIAALERCSLLVVPILSQGVPRAMLLMENTLSRGAFAADRLDAVMLIAGQLAVSLDNALLYEQLEGRVLERTRDLVRTNDALQAEISERKHLQGQLLQSEKLASIGQLAAGVAHEINNPIGYIFSNFGTLEKYQESLFEMLTAYQGAESSHADPQTVAQLKVLRERIELEFLKEDIPILMRESKEGIDRVRNIVRDLKDFSHVDATSDWQLVDLTRGIDSTLNVVSNEIKYKADVVKLYGAMPQVQCLASEINQVVMNLVVNAAHAIGPERGKITIRTGSDSGSDSAWFEVSDTGSGIPAESLARIFDPFYTTKPVGKGTGLGLSLSYGIVQKHHGRIEVQTEVGIGTTFRVTLPVAQTGLAQA